MIFEHTDYRNYVKSVLAAKVSNNENYSLRAFAKKLGFANSYLSEVLSGKKSLSTDAALKIALRLNLTDVETQYLCLQVQLESELDEEYRAILTEKINALKIQRKPYDLSADVFRVISDWFHFAILELTCLKNFKLTPKKAADTFGISMIEAETAIERLLRLELLEKDRNGVLRKTEGYVLAQSQIPDIGMKKFHKQLLAKAIQAVDEQGLENRLSTTDILPIDLKSLPQIKKLADEFSNSILKIAENSKNRDRVACLSIQMFQLTK